MSKTQISIDQHRVIGADLMRVSDHLGELAMLVQGRDHAVYAAAIQAGHALMRLRIEMNNKHRADHAPSPADPSLYFGRGVAKGASHVA